MSTKLKNVLHSYLSEEEIEHMVGSYDVVGDIAMVIVPDSLLHREALIGEAILAENRRVKVVVRRDGVYGGEFRTIGLKIIAGEERKETEVREFGVRLRLNLETVYYSVRSGNERKRLAGLVADGERVLVPFSGIAPFPLLIARHARPKLVVGVEKNPVACSYALQNHKLNGAPANVQLLEGDAEEVMTELVRLQPRFDRIIMPLPTAGEPFLGSALALLADGGMLHFYDMQHPDSFAESVDKVVLACTRTGRVLVDAQVHRCGHCGPKSYRICVDSHISR